MRPLHIFLNTAHSGCKPSSSVSSFTHSLQVFLPLPTHFTPATTTFLQADTQSSPFLRSTCPIPNHLNLPCLTTFAMLWKPKRLYKTSLLFLSFRDTPHIHLTIMCSALQAMQILSLYCPCLNPICQHALDTGPENLPLHAMWHTTGRQNGRELLELSPSTSHPSSSCLIHTSSCTKCVTQIAELGNTFQLQQPLSAKLTERGHSLPPRTSCNGSQHYSSTFLKCKMMTLISTMDQVSKLLTTEWLNKDLTF